MTGLERRRVLALISEAALQRLQTHRDCSRCQRWLERSEFPAHGTQCRTCEATRVREARAARRKAA